MEKKPVKKHKKLKLVLLIILILVLAAGAYLGITYHRITTNPAGEFKTTVTPAPANSSSSTMAPLIPITRPGDAP